MQHCIKCLFVCLFVCFFFFPSSSSSSSNACRFSTSKSGCIYLHSDIRMIIFRKSDMDTATDVMQHCIKCQLFFFLNACRFSSSKSGRIYLHSDIRMIIFRKSDMDTATAHGMDMAYELRSFTHGPTKPKFSPYK